MPNAQNTPPQTELLVCTKCRLSEQVLSTKALQSPASAPDSDTLLAAPDDAAPEQLRPGAQLYARLCAENTNPHLRITPVECLQNCGQGCSVALRGGAEKWVYIYGNLLEESHIDTLLEGARLYGEASDGLIPWRSRPDHFKKNCIARIPPLEAPHD